MRRVGPADPERLGQHRVGGAGADQGVDVVGMRMRLACGHESSADPHGIGAKSQCGTNGFGRADPAGGDDRHLDGSANCGEQFGERDVAAHVTAGLHSLGDHILTPGVDRRLCFVDGADLPTADHPGRDARGIGPLVEELDDRQARCHELDDVGLHEVGDACAADRRRGQRGQLVEVSLDEGQRLPTGADHPEPAGVGDCCGERRRGRAAHPRLLQRPPAADEIGEAVHAQFLGDSTVERKRRRPLDSGLTLLAWLLTRIKTPTMAGNRRLVARGSCTRRKDRSARHETSSKV